MEIFLRDVLATDRMGRTFPADQPDWAQNWVMVAERLRAERQGACSEAFHGKAAQLQGY
jgi:hypothetical protein